MFRWVSPPHTHTMTYKQSPINKVFTGWNPIDNSSCISLHVAKLPYRRLLLMCFVFGMTVVVSYIPCIVVWPPMPGTWINMVRQWDMVIFVSKMMWLYLYALQRVIPRTFALLYTKGNWIGHLGQPMQNSVISQETKSSWKWPWQLAGIQ